MDANSFGARLRHERETRGVSLEALSAATRISVRALEALETERWEQLPGGAFNRGFLRAIARHLSIDERALVADYASATNDPPQLLVLADAAPAQRNSRIWLAVAAAIVLAVLVLAGWLAYRHFRPASPVPAARRPVPAAAHASASVTPPRERNCGSSAFRREYS